jgi:ribonuclease Y
MLYIILPLAGLILGWILGWTIRWLYAKYHVRTAEQEAVRIKQNAVKEAEAKKKELLLEAKEQIIREKSQQERETRERRAELQRYERRVVQKEESIDKKTNQLERVEAVLVEKEKSFRAREAVISKEEERYKAELERISCLTQDEAKALIIKDLEDEARHDAQALVNKIEAEANVVSEKKAREIIVASMQRIAVDVTGEVTVASVTLPNDEMKGRIIGREGRNIRALETLTGVDIIIDDTPEAVVISCFDPVRREIAKIAMERLIMDGRIHPARIEEIVAKVSKEISQRIFEEGERVLFDMGIHNIKQDGIRALGRLYFRTSYGQNVLTHSKEVALIAGTLASEIGANRELTRRAALLHDIGKGVEYDSDLSHAEIGMEMARRMGEDPRVLNAIGAHHNDIEPMCIESIIVQIADAISAARPGARRESIDNYIKRLENLENIAVNFSGVDKSYAIQAGRELRIIVDDKSVNDAEAKVLAKQIAQKIETDLRYPGRIKVTIIRETRIVEYAR